MRRNALRLLTPYRCGLRALIIARKLLRIAFAVWTSGKPFNPDKVGKKTC